MPVTSPSASTDNGFSQEDAAIIAQAQSIIARRIVGRSLITSWSMLETYVQLHIAPLRVECAHVLYLDGKNRLIEDVEIARGAVDHVSICKAEIIRGALTRDARAIIICHNHPSGDLTPSRSDIQTTKDIITACHLFEIAMHDHVITGPNQDASAFSMKAHGLLD